MKIFAKLGILANCIVLISIVSCQKEQTAVVNQQNMSSPSNLKIQNVTFNNNMLVFKSKDEFNSAIQLLTKNQKSLENFELQYEGFESSYRAFKALKESDFEKINNNGVTHEYSDYVTIVKSKGDETISPVIDGIILSHLVNKEGLVQIGEDILKFTYDNLYIFNKKELSNYIQNRANLKSIQGLTTKKIERKEIEFLETRGVDRNPIEAANVWLFCGGKQCRKLTVRAEIVNTWAYNEVKAKVTNQKRGFLGRWYNQDCGDDGFGFIRLTGTLLYFYDGAERVGDVNDLGGSNSAEIHQVVHSNGFIGSYSGFHSGSFVFGGMHPECCGGVPDFSVGPTVRTADF